MTDNVNLFMILIWTGFKRVHAVTESTCACSERINVCIAGATDKRVPGEISDKVNLFTQ